MLQRKISQDVHAIKSSFNFEILSSNRLNSRVILADNLEVSYKSLLSNSQIILKGKDLLNKSEVDQDMHGDTKLVAVTFFVMPMSDFKTQLALSL